MVKADSIMPEIRNARILKTRLGTDDGPVFSFELHVEDEMGGWKVGGYTLDKPSEKGRGGRVPTVLVGMFVGGIMDVLNVRAWEDVAGEYVRLQIGPMGKCIAIGHITQNRWLVFEELIAEYMAKEQNEQR